MRALSQASDWEPTLRSFRAVQRPDTDPVILTAVQERKYFDSGDYAMSKAGVSPPQSVGTAIPSPADIPHASPPSAQSIPGAKVGSPTSGGSDEGGVGVGTSPPKQSSFGVGSPSKEPISQMRPYGQ